MNQTTTRRRHLRPWRALIGGASLAAALTVGVVEAAHRETEGEGSGECGASDEGSPGPQVAAACGSLIHGIFLL